MGDGGEYSRWPVSNGINCKDVVAIVNRDVEYRYCGTSKRRARRDARRKSWTYVSYYEPGDDAEECHKRAKRRCFHNITCDSDVMHLTCDECQYVTSPNDIDPQFKDSHSCIDFYIQPKQATSHNNISQCSKCYENALKHLHGLQTKLFNAVIQRNAWAVREILNISNLNPNFQLNRTTPIWRAISVQDLQIVKLLLDAGANPNTPDVERSEELTLLHYALSLKRSGITQLLVKYGADVNRFASVSFGVEEQTPLMMAAAMGHVRIIKCLIDAGASVNAAQTDGYTALHLATCLGWRKSCELLIAGGADLLKTNNQGWTPFHSAVVCRNPGIVKMFLRKGFSSLTITDKDENNALHLSTKWSIKLLLSHGVPLEARNSNGSTPLMKAVYSGDIKVVFHLVKAGADVNVVNHKGKSPIYYAAACCSPEIIQILMFAGCFVPHDLPLRDVKIYAPSVADELISRCNQVPTLKERCLITIRLSLAPNLQANTHLLPLPDTLKRQLVMENLVIVRPQRRNDPRLV